MYNSIYLSTIFLILFCWSGDVLQKSGLVAAASSNHFLGDQTTSDYSQQDFFDELDEDHDGKLEMDELMEV